MEAAGGMRAGARLKRTVGWWVVGVVVGVTVTDRAPGGAVVVAWSLG